MVPHLVFHVQIACSLVFSLVLVTSAATPIFGVAVLHPLPGTTIIAAAGLIAPAMNLAVPTAVTLFEIDAAEGTADRPDPGDGPNARRRPVPVGLLAGPQPPLPWVPIPGCAIASSGWHLPSIIGNPLDLIGSATAGAAVLAVGIILSGQHLSLSRPVLLAGLGTIGPRSACLFVPAGLLGAGGAVYGEALTSGGVPFSDAADRLSGRPWVSTSKRVRATPGAIEQAVERGRAPRLSPRRPLVPRPGETEATRTCS